MLINSVNLKWKHMNRLYQKIGHYFCLLLWVGLSILLVVYLNSINFFKSTNDLILFLTLMALIWYAYETRGLKNETVTQTQLHQKPILAVYIRLDKNSDLKDYRLVADHPYVVRIRNVGHGASANLKAIVQKGDRKFKVTSYQQNFLESEGDEQAIKVGGVNSVSDLNGAMIIVSCQDFSERWTSQSRPYEFKYEIEDIEKMRVRYIEDER